MALPEKNPALKNIAYISVPEDISREIGNFSLDPSILLPVEIPENSRGFEIEQLSWDQIVSALCKIIAWDRENINFDYYRDFLLAVRPEIETELSLAGVKKAEEKKFDLAEELFLVLTNLFPENTGHFLNLALAYENHGNQYADLSKTGLAEKYRELAFMEYMKAIKMAPESPEVQFNAGHFFFSQGNYEKASGCFREYLKHGKDEKRIRLLKEILSGLEKLQSTDNLFKQAYDLIIMDRETEGLEKIDRFLEEQPEVWNGWFLKGWAHRRIGEYEEGKNAFEKAYSLTIDNVDLLNELAICTMETGEFRKSRTYLESALKMEPDNVKIISNLGILSIKAGNLSEAGGFFRTVIAFDENDEIAKKYLEYIEKEISC